MRLGGAGVYVGSFYLFFLWKKKIESKWVLTFGSEAHFGKAKVKREAKIGYWKEEDFSEESITGPGLWEEIEEKGGGEWFDDGRC